MKNDASRKWAFVLAPIFCACVCVTPAFADVAPDGPLSGVESLPPAIFAAAGVVTLLLWIRMRKASPSAKRTRDLLKSSIACFLVSGACVAAAYVRYDKESADRNRERAAAYQARQESAERERTRDWINFYVAEQPIKKGDLLFFYNLAVKKVPPDEVPKTAITADEKVDLHLAAVDIPAGTQIEQAMVGAEASPQQIATAPQILRERGVLKTAAEFSDKGAFAVVLSDSTSAAKAWEAIAYLDEAIKLDASAWSHDWTPYGWRGRCYNRLGLYDKALSDFDTAIAHGDDRSYNERAEAYLGLKRYEDAIKDADRVLAKPDSRDDSEALLTSGRAYSALGRDKEALSDLDAAVKSNPNRAITWYHRSLLFTKLGDKTRAAADMKAALATGDVLPSQSSQ